MSPSVNKGNNLLYYVLTYPFIYIFSQRKSFS